MREGSRPIGRLVVCLRVSPSVASAAHLLLVIGQVQIDLLDGAGLILALVETHAGRWGGWWRGDCTRR
jgi:hypothetical protein